MTSININLRDGQSGPSSAFWPLPAHSHPMNAGVFLLVKQVGETFLPIGSAFSIGNFEQLFITATHVVQEAIRDDRVLQHRTGPLEGTLQLGVPLFVCMITRQDNRMGLTLLPVTQAKGFPPTDAMFLVTSRGAPIRLINHRLSFDYPKVGQTVFSVGFASSGTTPAGVTSADIQSGKLDWDRAFAATLSVAERRVTRLFPSGHSSFLSAPCFEFDGPMVPGMSGGPIITQEGLIVGINSADASMFQHAGGTGASLGSPLSPLLFGKTTIPLIQGPVTINFELDIIGLIARGLITTDGSEENVWFDHDPDGKLVLYSRVDHVDLPASYESLAQALENASLQKGAGVASGFRLKKRQQ